MNRAEIIAAHHAAQRVTQEARDTVRAMEKALHCARETLKQAEATEAAYDRGSASDDEDYCMNEPILISEIDRSREQHKRYVTIYFTNTSIFAIVYWYNSSVRFYDRGTQKEPEVVPFEVLSHVRDFLAHNEEKSFATE